MSKTRVVIHCTASDVNNLNLPFRSFLDGVIRYWKSNGWTRGGYAVIIWIDGTTAVWRSGFDYEITDFKSANFDDRTNGASGYNTTSIHVCYAGGLRGTVAADTRTDAQKAKMEEIVKYLKSKYPISEIVGHRDLFQYNARTGQFLNKKVAKACPSFDVAPS